MTKTVEETYVALRWRILRGTIPAAAPVTIAETTEEFGVDARKARAVLHALAEDGYLTRTGRRFAAAAYSTEQLDEWRYLLCALAEIGAGALAIEQGPRLAEMRRIFDENLTQWLVTEERFYQAVMKMISLLFGGPPSGLPGLSRQMVPQAFIRMMWLADCEYGGHGLITVAFRELLEQAGKGDIARTKAACSLYVDGLADTLHAQAEARNRSVPWDEVSTWQPQEIEPTIDGFKLYIGARLRGEPLLPPLGKVRDCLRFGLV